ncbi:serine--tRNA ligase [Cephaloticoccus primus]|uniref:Serine--tRNA ligase n=1 Tax=Cephaloticoccus primus TaxID=1548207 RepID=A0A139SPX3_9BACT|nr:serine--tRNA ligase [Cephaloticoccus primus]KXU36582.1 serine--tRNA ligase [Cephaloticoccus primus]
MLDPKLLRESPELVRAGIAKKHLDIDLDAVLSLDAAWRSLVSEVESLRAAQKTANTAMAALPKGSPEFLAKVQEMKAASATVKEKEAQLKETEEHWREAMLSLPNLPHPSVPEGRTPEENQTVAEWGAATVSFREALAGASSEPDATGAAAVTAATAADAAAAGVGGEAQQNALRPHWEIPGFERLFDFSRGAKVTGAGFPFFIGQGARLARALINFFLSENAKAGYLEVSPPIFVNAASATATGQLPDKEGQMYETREPLYAVPTAEVPLTNFYRDEIVDESALPIRRCAYTPCFRREAGSYGKDVRGLNRLHQFDKVELLKWVHPKHSYAELEGLRADAEALLRKLELPYRVLLMCGGDLGFAQAKKYDLEVWAAGQARWLEVSSCSNFEAFQARRAQIRYRSAETGRPEVVHTLNGSGLAVPRVLAALLENNLQADGRVKLPAALVPHFGDEYLSFA